MGYSQVGLGCWGHAHFLCDGQTVRDCSCTIYRTGGLCNGSSSWGRNIERRTFRQRARTLPILKGVAYIISSGIAPLTHLRTVRWQPGALCQLRCCNYQDNLKETLLK
jgi:hypothetical protein